MTGLARQTRCGGGVDSWGIEGVEEKRRGWPVYITSLHEENRISPDRWYPDTAGGEEDAARILHESLALPPENRDSRVERGHR